MNTNNGSSVVIRLQTVAAVTVPAQGNPFVNKKGQTVQDFEASIAGVGSDGTMCRIRVRGKTAEQVAASVKPYVVGKPADVPVWPRMQGGLGGILADAKL